MSLTLADVRRIATEIGGEQQPPVEVSPGARAPRLPPRSSSLAEMTPYNRAGWWSA